MHLFREVLKLDTNRPWTLGGMSTRRTLSPKMSAFQTWINSQFHLRKLPRETRISHTHPARLWGNSLFEISSLTSLFYGTSDYHDASIRKVLLCSSNVGFRKGSIRRGSAIDLEGHSAKARWILAHHIHTHTHPPIHIWTHTYLHTYTSLYIYSYVTTVVRIQAVSGLWYAITEFLCFCVGSCIVLIILQHRLQSHRNGCSWTACTVRASAAYRLSFRGLRQYQPFNNTRVTARPSHQEE
jgi:hypothetical protein